MLVHNFQSQELIGRLRNKVSEDKYNSLIEWPTVILDAQAHKYEKEVLESSLTVFSNFRGQVLLELEGRRLRICEQTFLVINPFQKFHFKSDEPINVFNIHFNYKQHQQILHSLIQNCNHILDHADAPSLEFSFTEQLHIKDQSFTQLIQEYNPDSEEDFLMQMLTYLLQKETTGKKHIQNLKAVKSSVREELWKRMLMAKDFIYSHYDLPQFTMEILCKEIGMSKYHFLRVFRHFFSCTPYQFLKKVRIERACYFLKHTDLDVQEIAYRIGYQEANSFYQVFRQFFKQSPGAYRATFR